MALNFEFQKSEYGLVDEGIYEMNLKVSLKTSKNGKDYISLDWRIRDDVEQENQGRHVFEAIFEKKDQPGTFHDEKLTKILSVQGKEGRYHFDDIDEVLQFINGWNVRCGVKIGEPDEYKTEEYNFISFYSATKNPTQTLTTNVEKTKTVNQVDIPDDDLPF